jgi:hypothetical protein
VNRSKNEAMLTLSVCLPAPILTDR